MLYFIFAGTFVTEAFAVTFAVVLTLSTDAYFLFWYVNIIVYISFEKLILKQPI